MNIVELATSYPLSTGVVFLSMAVVLFALVQRESALRPHAWWSGDKLTYIVHAPILTVLSAAGAGFTIAGINHLTAQPVSPQAVAIAGSAVLIAAAVHLALPRGGERKTVASHRNA